MAGLYLASQSPRRTELLTQVGIDHIVVSVVTKSLMKVTIALLRW